MRITGGIMYKVPLGVNRLRSCHNLSTFPELESEESELPICREGAHRTDLDQSALVENTWQSIHNRVDTCKCENLRLRESKVGNHNLSGGSMRKIQLTNSLKNMILPVKAQSQWQSMNPVLTRIDCSKLISTIRLCRQGIISRYCRIYSDAPLPAAPDVLSLTEKTRGLVPLLASQGHV